MGALALSAAAPAQAAGTFTSYPTPTPASIPCVTAGGPDGAAWFVEALANRIGRIDPATGETAEFPIPWSTAQLPASLNWLNLPVATPAPVTALPCAITAGPDGKIYFANGLRNQLGSIDPQTKAFALYSVPGVGGNLFPFNDLAADPAGAIWFTQTTANTIGRFDIATKTFTSYPVPTPGALPIGVFTGSNGDVWFTEALGNKIGRIDATTRTITEYPVPSLLAVPFVMRAETDGGRYVWFTELGASKLGRIDTVTGSVSEVPVPVPLSFPIGICSSPQGKIYFTYLLRDKLGAYDPATGVFTETSVPGGPLGPPAELNYGPGDAVWMAQLTGSRVLRYSPA
ncbi:hypothetical protein CcI49_30380 [Frankia sp. CcI49]|uniref:Vgb family protein n=1 Tax=Frankia sp. CcI49 TaxID=1745382 RepID=UPI00097566B6|nr:SMP-30/gluconolactonase/LRE family protein [Frankia sp. CcI49]ONH54664.1 hypothetical protein CcI49_30380 [Frankia sp. CcI49]